MINKVMLITGTRKGIGKYLVEYYSKKGFKVIGCSRKPVDYKLKNYEHFCLDVSDENKVKEMFAKIKKKYNRLDVLINNAGIISLNYIILTATETVRNILDTNFIGTFLFCREGIKLMKKNNFGRIVNISSIAVPLQSIGSSIYSSSKAAIEQFSGVLSKEVASYGITVNTLGLSFVKGSGMIKKFSEKVILETLDRTILKSSLNFKDITPTIDFLISNRMITNQRIYLGGIKK